MAWLITYIKTLDSQHPSVIFMYIQYGLPFIGTYVDILTCIVWVFKMVTIVTYTMAWQQTQLHDDINGHTIWVVKPAAANIKFDD